MTRSTGSVVSLHASIISLEPLTPYTKPDHQAGVFPMAPPPILTPQLKSSTTAPAQQTPLLLHQISQSPKARGIAVIVTLASITFLNTMGSSILIAALPRIAQDVGVPESLILWAAAVYSLAAGVCSSSLVPSPTSLARSSCA
ncbi:hypothetical protein ACJZ2D_005540 [Fusarium nematophilum]